ncbi:MAG: class I SAM-dependent methyltransferase [Thermodesulfobacteriota bacterium]
MNFLSLLKKLPIDLGQSERKHNAAAKRIAFSFVPETEEKVALDIGCRDGFWSEQLKKKGYNVLAIDIKPSYRESIICDVENGIPFSDESFNLVWCTEVIEHLHNPKYLFQEIERVIRPGGLAIITTPNSSCWYYSIFRLFKLNPQKLQNPDHKHFFDEKSIRSLASGYTVYGYFPYVFFFIRISKFIELLSPTFILIKVFT